MIQSIYNDSTNSTCYILSFSVNFLVIINRKEKKERKMDAFTYIMNRKYKLIAISQARNQEEN